MLSRLFLLADFQESLTKTFMRLRVIGPKPHDLAKISERVVVLSLRR